MRRLSQELALASVAVLASPAWAWACPVCFSAKNEESRVAFLVTTVFLTALPLLLVGGVIYWVMKRAAMPEPRESVDVVQSAIEGDPSDVSQVTPAPQPLRH